MSAVAATPVLSTFRCRQRKSVFRAPKVVNLAEKGRPINGLARIDQSGRQWNLSVLAASWQWNSATRSVA